MLRPMDTAVRAMLPLVQLWCAAPKTIEVEARYLTPPAHRPSDKPSPVVSVAHVQELIAHLKSMSDSTPAQQTLADADEAKGALWVTQLEDVEEMDFYFDHDEEVRNTQQTARSMGTSVVVKNQWLRKSKAILSQTYLVPERPFLVKTTVKSELKAEPLTGDRAKPTMHRAKMRSRFLLQRVKDGGVSSKVGICADLTIVRSGASLAEMATTKPVGEIEFELIDMRKIDLGLESKSSGSTGRETKEYKYRVEDDRDFVVLTEQEQLQVSHNLVTTLLELQGKPDGSLLLLKEGLGVLIPTS